MKMFRGSSMASVFETLKKDNQIYSLVKNAILAATKDNKKFSEEFEINFTRKAFQERIDRFSKSLKENDFYSDMKIIVFTDMNGNILSSAFVNENLTPSLFNF
jgi:hypothetical protein